MYALYTMDGICKYCFRNRFCFENSIQHLNFTAQLSVATSNCHRLSIVTTRVCHSVNDLKLSIIVANYVCTKLFVVAYYYYLSTQLATVGVKYCSYIIVKNKTTTIYIP